MPQVDITAEPLIVTTSLSAGLPIGIVAPPLQVSTLMGATLTPYVYVVDSGNHRVQAFDYSGNFRFQFGSYGTGNGQFINPYGIANNGTYLYVTDSGNNRVQIFDLLGNYQGKFGNGGTDPGEFDNPMGIAVDERFIWVVDSNNHRFQVFTLEGDSIFWLGKYGSGLNEFKYPTDCSVDSLYFYITDAGNNRVVIYLKNFNFLDTINADIAALECDISGTLTNNYIDAQLPDISTEGDFSGVVGDVGYIDAELPSLECEMLGGSYIDAILPAFEFEGSGITGIVGDIDAEIPYITSDIRGIVNIAGDIDAEMPVLTVVFEAASGSIGSIDVTLPALIATASGFMGQLASIEAILPALSSDISSYQEIIGDIEVELPALYIDAYGTITPAIITYKGVVMNTETKGITEYENYPFNSLCFFKGKYLGANETGIFELDGDDDNGVDIASSIKSGNFDMHQGTDTMPSVVKRIREAYMLYRTDGDLRLNLQGDESTIYPYDVNEKITPDKRIKFGRGLRHRLYSIELENLNGSDFEIEHLRVLMEPIKHRVR